MSQYGFYFNADICTSCRTCVMACKDKNSLAPGVKYRKVYDYASGSWSVENGVCTPENVFVYSVSVACMHCATPMCFAACPTGAIKKRDDGIVYVTEEECDGCGACVDACPYDEPRINEETGKMGKCDMCREYVDQGLNPACVDACRTRALRFGELSELQAEYGTNADILPLPDSSETGPSFVVMFNRANPGNDDTGAVTNSPEELQ